HRVPMVCSCDQPFEWRGVDLLPGRMLAAEQEKPCDLLTVHRDPKYVRLRDRAPDGLGWLHGQIDRGAAAGLLQDAAAADRTGRASAWHTGHLRSVLRGLPPESIIEARNGIDLELIAEALAEPPERDPYRLLYTSRPERGLEVLLRGVLPRVLAE